MFLSDLQRLVVSNDSGFSMLETVSQEEAYTLKKEFNLLPTSKLFASSPERYRAEDSAEDSEAGEGFIEEDSIERERDIP